MQSPSKPSQARRRSPRPCDAGMARAHRRVRRPSKPFVHAEGRFLAWPLRAVLTILNGYASMKGGSAMKRGNCLMAFGVAIAVNCAAVLAVKAAIGDAPPP